MIRVVFINAVHSLSKLTILLVVQQKLKLQLSSSDMEKKRCIGQAYVLQVHVFMENLDTPAMRARMAMV